MSLFPHQRCQTPRPNGGLPPDPEENPSSSTAPPHTCLSPGLTKAVRKWCRVTGSLKPSDRGTAWSHDEWSKFLWFQWAAQHRGNGRDLPLLDWLLTEPDDTS